VPLFRKRCPSDEIAPANDHRQLHAHLRYIHALSRDRFQLSRVDSKTAFMAKSFAADFEEDSLIRCSG
jgi:hypothetical protein